MRGSENKTTGYFPLRRATMLCAPLDRSAGTTASCPANAAILLRGEARRRARSSAATRRTRRAYGRGARWPPLETSCSCTRTWSGDRMLGYEGCGGGGGAAGGGCDGGGGVGAGGWPFVPSVYVLDLLQFVPARSGFKTALRGASLWGAAVFPIPAAAFPMHRACSCSTCRDCGPAR